MGKTNQRCTSSKNRYCCFYCRLCRRNRTGKRRIHRKRRKKAPFKLFSTVVFGDLVTSDQFTPLPKQDTSNKSVYSYAVINRGNHAAIVQLEVGPNGQDYAVDYEWTVPKGKTEVIIPTKFMHYTRLQVRSQQPEMPTELEVFFQAQHA